ncbi:MAG: DUF1501 domain-containing protein [Verrucomicrobia bacterium]|nr:DUF1501 domain-containing protein [Verrucomicrobiota bacterium]
MRSRFIPNPTPCGRTRREFLWEVGAGFAGLGLIDLLSRDGFFSASAAEVSKKNSASPLAPKPAHFPTRAKHCIFLFMNGAPSQVDTFDPKPALTKFHGSPYTGKLKVGSNGRPIGYLMQSPFEFKKHGQGGLDISSLFPHTARHADRLCVLRSLYTDTAAHASGCLQMNTGNVQIGKPSLGAWLSYGLGTLNDNLPSFVVMTDPRGGPIGSASNWTAGFMPAPFQGTLFRSKGSPLLDLATPAGVGPRTQRRSLDVLEQLNREHLKSHPNDSELLARIMSYELAYQMQTSAAQVVDVNDESPQTRSLYGLDDKLTADFGAKCLIARRLIEKGVRFVQLYSGGGHIEDTWDGHNDCINNHKLHAGETDKPIAALLTDLKRTGLLDETLVVWGGEFGRTPTSEGVGKPGRDHNWLGFSMWLAGAGVRGGQWIGATDELGFEAVEERAHVSDLHATILHLMGLEHERLTYFYQGFDQRLTGTRGEVIKKVLA